MSMVRTRRPARWVMAALAALWLPLGAAAGAFLMGGTGSLAVPTGDIKTFTDDQSFRGGTLEFRDLGGDRFSWGVLVGLHVFSFRSNDPTTLEGVTVGGGDQYRWTNVVPLYLTADWYPVTSTDGISIFVGGGAGPTRVIRRVDVSWNRTQEDSWHLSVAPEIGMLIPVGLDWKLFAKAQYHYGFDDGERWGPRYLSLDLGFAEF